MLARIIQTVGELRPLRQRGSLFAHLARVIIAQQISVAAATSITRRVGKVCHGQLIPDRILAAGLDDLRAAGCSGNKARFLLSLAEAEQQGRSRLRSLSRLDDATVHARLCQLPGIGPWSAEMVLIFRLARPDTFSPGDIGLRRAMERAYQVPTGLSVAQWQAEALRLSAPWQPYRSWACRYLWAWGDADIVYE